MEIQQIPRGSHCEAEIRTRTMVTRGSSLWWTIEEIDREHREERRGIPEGVKILKMEVWKSVEE